MAHRRLALLTLLAALLVTSQPLEAAAQQTDVRTRYTFIVTLDYERHAADVQQNIQYTNQTGESLSTIVLVVDPNRYQRAFELLSVQLGNGIPVRDYILNGIRLTIPLTTPLAPGEVMDIYLDYDLTLPYLRLVKTEEGGWPDPFGFTPRQTNLTEWYPYIPPHSPEIGWVVHQPQPYGEHQVYPLADFDIHLTVTPAPENLVIAASARPQNAGDPYRYQLNSARNFVFSISDSYEVQQTEVNGTTLRAYHIPSGDNAGEIAFQAFVDAFTLYDDLFIDYPYDSLTLVEADFSLSMEYQGLVFVSRDAYNPYASEPDHALTRLTAHETAHQWWYGLVGSDQALEPWLDEALATYSERLFYENVHPEALEWWDFRLEVVQARRLLNRSIYHTGHSEAYFDQVYLTGAKFLHDLRQTIGDEAFFEFLRTYAQQHQNQIVTAEDFFRTLADVTDTDTRPVVSRYFQTIEQPDIPVSTPFPPGGLKHMQNHLKPQVK